LVSIGLVISEEKIFEKVYDEGRQVMAIAPHDPSGQVSLIMFAQINGFSGLHIMPL
jgi:hypothetical protein